MNDHHDNERTELKRRTILKTAGAAVIAGFAGSTFAQSAAAQEARPMSAA